MKEKPKKMMRKVVLAALCVELLATSGCVVVNPDGTVNNTATDAVVGGTVGALSGALIGGRHAGEGALIGGLAGVFAGAMVGSAMDERQREYLRAYYPQTYQTVQYNDAVVYQQQHPQYYQQPQNYQQPPASSQPSQPAASPPTGVVPLTLNDIKALTAAGVKPDAINKEIDISQSKFSARDITAAQQANPPIDAAVIRDMKSHSS